MTRAEFIEAIKKSGFTYRETYNINSEDEWIEFFLWPRISTSRLIITLTVHQKYFNIDAVIYLACNLKFTQDNIDKIMNSIKVANELEVKDGKVTITKEQIPNKITMDAINEASNIDNLKSYDSVKELMTELSTSDNKTLTKDEFLDRLVDADFIYIEDGNSYQHKITDLRIWPYGEYFGMRSYYKNNLFKYTESNLNELINAAKVFERLEEVE